MSVTVENNLPLDSTWVQNFLAIANAWEEYATKKEISIDGLLNAYGIEFQLDMDDTSFLGRRKQEFTKGGAAVQDLAPNPFSEILEVTGNLATNENLKFSAVQKNRLSQLNELLAGLKQTAAQGNWIVFSNIDDQDLIEIANWFIEHTELHFFRIDNNRFKLRLLSIPTSQSQIADLEDAVNRIKAVASKAGHNPATA